MRTTTKDLKQGTMAREQAFFYPTLGRTIMAKSQEEADKILQSELKKKEVAVSK